MARLLTRRLHQVCAAVRPRLPTSLQTAAGIAALTCLSAPTAPATAQDRPLTAEFPEVYRAGGVDAPDWALFTRPGPLGFDASGNLHILDAGAPHVVVIGPDGRLVRTVGREGEGPGEFDNPSDLVMWRDCRFAVLDPFRNALQLFGADGEFQRMVRWSGRPGSPAALIGSPAGSGPGSSPADGARVHPFPRTRASCVLDWLAPRFISSRKRSRQRFADRFGLDVRAVQEWEQGRLRPGKGYPGTRLSSRRPATPVGASESSIQGRNARAG